MIGICVFALALVEQARASDVVDSLQFGNAASEQSHKLDARQSETADGALGQTARRILPRSTDHWRGGRVTFRLRVDPEELNYFTAKFWGSDYEKNEKPTRLFLFVEGKQVGQRHLGQIDPLDIRELHPRFSGRFFYKTLPLPLALTQGKTTVEVGIELHGRIWGYGDTFERYQHNLDAPSRDIYQCYSHTDPCFQPDGNEVQGTAPELKVRREPGEEVIKEVRKRINQAIKKSMRSDRIPDLQTIRFLSNACFEKWTDAYHNKEVLERIVKGIDHQYLAFRKDPTIFEKEWVGAGEAAEAIRILAKPLRFYVDKPVEGTETSRREAWTEMFVASRDWHVQHRRAYTNQTMIVDLNIYRCNRAVRYLSPRMDWPERKAVGLLHEAVGIKPWAGNWDQRGRPSFPKGKRYMQLTDEGLTRELGYVGAYGEIVGDFVRNMYESTRPTLDAEGDPEIKEQLVKIVRARAAFRYPSLDDDGNRAMRLEATVGWRDWKYPGNVMYGQMPTVSGGPVDIAASTEDPILTGYAQQMLTDNQFFAGWKYIAGLRNTETLDTTLRLPRVYEWIKNQPPMKHRLPMSQGQPNYVFADPGVGVVAIKNNDDILYVSLYWRARYAVNNLSRVHYLTPTIERDATVFTEARFNASGDFYEIPDWTNMGFNKKHEDEYKKEGLNLATAGMRLPIAKVPASQKDFKPGKENIYAGKADLYLLHYGPYYIAMNCSRSRSFSFDVPDRFLDSKNLVTKERVTRSKLKIRGKETIVLFQKP